MRKRCHLFGSPCWEHIFLSAMSVLLTLHWNPPWTRSKKPMNGNEILRCFWQISWKPNRSAAFRAPKDKRHPRLLITMTELCWLKKAHWSSSVVYVKLWRCCILPTDQGRLSWFSHLESGYHYCRLLRLLHSLINAITHSSESAPWTHLSPKTLFIIKSFQQLRHVLEPCSW